MAIKSNHALLDVTSGRASLVKRVEKSDVHVVIRGAIIDVWGGDDGTSQEFVVRVTDVKELKRAPVKRKRR